jgi:glycosyltransferase involved in cell wall biosynthesis
MTVSTEEAADARRWWIHRGATPILNGRDPARFHPDQQARTAIRASLGVADSQTVVIIVSRLVRHKGHLELAASLRTSDALLWVVGNRLDSDRGEDIESALRQAGLGDRLMLLGYREDVPALLAAADIFALPSHFEGLPMSVIEAMLVGLPVVATDTRGPREQVVDGQTGFLVPPRDVPALAMALQQLNQDPALRVRMGQAGQARALLLYDEQKVRAHTLDLLFRRAHPPAA